MRKYLIMLPVILYPYLYIFFFIGASRIYDIIPQEFREQHHVYVEPFSSAIIVHLLVLIALIFFIVWSIRGTYTAAQLSKLTMIAKLVQIPAFILHFILGALSFLASVWGLGILIWAIVLDLLTISQTGILGIFTSVRGAKENRLTKIEAVIFAILNCLYVVDVITAIVEFVRIRSAEKRAAESMDGSAEKRDVSVAGSAEGSLAGSAESPEESLAGSQQANAESMEGSAD